MLTKAATDVKIQKTEFFALYVLVGGVSKD